MKTAEEILKEKGPRMHSVPPDATVRSAVAEMARRNIGSILVMEGSRIVGIWTERDLLHQAADSSFDPHRVRIGECMRTDLKSAPADTPVESLTDMLLGLYIRHVLIEKDGEYLGLLSIGDVLRAILLQKDREIKSLNRIASWEYYEDWGWDRRFEKESRANAPEDRGRANAPEDRGRANAPEEGTKTSEKTGER